MKWDTVVQIVLMIGFLASLSSNLRYKAELDSALLVAATYRACLDVNMTLPYCEEFVIPAVIKEMSNE